MNVGFIEQSDPTLIALSLSEMTSCIEVEIVDMARYTMGMC